MGYTNYYCIDSLTDEVLADAKKLITQAARRDIVTRGHNGSGQPVLTADEIVINGDFSAGLSCENLFLRPPKPDREPYAHWFVKTQGHPYDEVVTAILVSARLHTGARFNPDNLSWDITYDGKSAAEAAIAVWQQTFRRGPFQPNAGEACVFTMTNGSGDTAEVDLSDEKFAGLFNGRDNPWHPHE